MRKVISLMLAVLLLIPTAVTVSAAETGTPTSGTCGDSAVWSFTDSTLTISGIGTVVSQYPNQPWWDLREQIARIVVEEGITELGECCFLSHYNVRFVTLPDSLVKIGYGAFWWTELEQLVLPDGLTTIGRSAFFGAGFSSIEIPGTVKNNEKT